MAAGKTISKEEFVTRFKFQYALATKNDVIMESYESYKRGIAQLRSDSIQYLRSLGIGTEQRIELNDAIQRLSQTSHRKYLFHKDPHCGICGFVITRIEEATIDHIHPLAHGGENSFENKQIAHGKCNVKKSDKIGFTMKKRLL